MTDEILPAGRDDGGPPVRWGGGGGGNDNDDGGTDENGNNGNGNTISREEASRIIDFVEEVLMVGLADHLFIKNKNL